MKAFSPLPLGNLSTSFLVCLCLYCDSFLFICRLFLYPSLYYKKKSNSAVRVADEGGSSATCWWVCTQLTLYLNILEDSKGRRRPKYHYWAVRKVFSFTRLNKYPEQFRQNFVNPLKICKLRVDFGCSYCSHAEVRVGCCFTQWVRCIPIVSIANVTLNSRDAYCP